VGGDDRIVTAGGADFVFGEGSVITDRARAGDDRIDAGAGDDTVYGDGSSLSGRPVCGADTLIGGAGADLMYGDADVATSDVTTVTRGRDRFLFDLGSGLDTIGDFEAQRDVIDLRAYSGIGGFAAVKAHATDTDEGLVIDLGAAAGTAALEDTVTLVGLTLADLRAGSFDFG
jgi:Ca2+-binding RTX toxin-like protein